MAVRSRKQKRQRRKQKQVERRNTKRKAKRRVLVRRNPDSTARQMQQAASAPVLDCFTTEALWDEGIASLLFSRRLSDGRVAVAMFLVDAYCLGIKDAMAVIASAASYRERFAGLLKDPERLDLTPQFARKLVEGAVEYARGLGFEPHRDYRKAAPLFGNVDADECAEEFEFGREGKPFFIAGPHDSPRKCRRIVNTLEASCGEDGFDYMVPGDSGQSVGYVLSDGEEGIGRTMHLVSRP